MKKLKHIGVFRSGSLAICMALSIGTHAADTDLGISGQLSGSAPVDIGSSFTFEVQPSNFGSVTSGSVSIVLDISSYAGSGSASITGSSSSAAYSCTPPPVTTMACTLAAGLASGTHASLAETLSFTVANSGATDGDSIPLSYSISHADSDAESGNDSGSESVTVEDADALALCYSVADRATGGSGGDWPLVSIRNNGTNRQTLGPTGNNGSIEAITFGLTSGSPQLFATATDQFGEIDFLNSPPSFTAIGAAMTTINVDRNRDGDVQDTNEQNQAINDVDGLTFHPQTLQIWGTEREGGSDFDFVFAIDYTTGVATVDTLGQDGAGDDIGGVAINIGQCPLTGVDADDIAISNDGQWLVQIDNGGPNQQIGLLEIVNGLPTGNLTRCLPLVNSCDGNDPVDDMEGTGYDESGQLWGSTGANSNNATGAGSCPGDRNDNRMWMISDTPVARTGSGLTDAQCQGSGFEFDSRCGFEATRVGDLFLAVPGTDEIDFESLDCRVPSNSSVNIINGTVWADNNGDTMYNFATETTGQSGVTVNLYQDTDNSGTINAGDLLLQTTTTDTNGEYDFFVASAGDFLVQIDTNDLPADTVITTDNIEVTSFSGTGLTESNNDFGFVDNTDYGDAPASYGDAAHTIVSTLFIGSVSPDRESLTLDSSLADGDDGNLPTSDEEGVSFFALLGGGVRAVVDVSNDTGGDAYICAWLDRWDGSGNGDGDFDASDPEDGGVICQTVADNNLVPTSATFDWGGASLPDVAGFTYVRFRLCSTLSECNVPTSSSSPGSASVTNSTSSAINDNSCFVRNFVVTEDFSVDDVTFTVDIDHTWRADLELTLTSPASTSIDLTSDNGGSADHLIVVFDDAAGTSIVGDFFTHSAPAVDRSPEVALSAFDGENTTGTWVLEICDDAGADQGIFNTATLNITGINTNTTATDGEVEDYRIDFDFTPTAVTMGDVSLEAVKVGDFLGSMGASQMSSDQLLELLSVFSREAAQSLTSVEVDSILASLDAYLDPDGDGRVALLIWDTLEERGTIGFFVERQQQDGSWITINNEMLPGMLTAPMGGEYMLADPGAMPGAVYRYRLIEQEATGDTRTYGPFLLEMR